MGSHKGWRGVAYTRHFHAVAEQFLLESPLARLQVAYLCAQWVNWLDAQASLTQALETPTKPFDLQRARRRESIAAGAYQRAMKQLTEDLPRRQPSAPTSGLELMRSTSNGVKEGVV
jgi:hypothetical protein